MADDQNTDSRQGPRIDVILREALLEFDAPIAFVAAKSGPEGGPVRAYASVPVLSPAGAVLGTLSILGPPRARAASLAQLPRARRPDCVRADKQDRLTRRDQGWRTPSTA